MTDFWSLLLQTLTASGVAALLLVVKAMFRDKLSPRWQFAVWGVLALVLLLPAGFGGRYVLFNWPLLVETLKSRLTGDFGTLTKVIAPVPLPSLAAPETMADCLYLVYVAGAVLLLARYVVSYVRLRLALKKGRPIRCRQVGAVGEAYGLDTCPAVEVEGLPTAFICGVLKPVLALPAGGETDEKVILHELLHLKHNDVIWGWVICFFRCLHWCNPLIWLCADWAGNDLESLCDQRVMERLEGEDRRDYGRILLSMADEKYARAPGTSSSANGGENVRRRIEAIARFKRYPAGMALASVCVALVLAAPLVTGARAEGLAEDGTGHLDRIDYAMASARTVRCTTCAGAFDAYGKALMSGNLLYRAMCAPLAEQDELAALYRDRGTGLWPREANGMPGYPENGYGEGYRVYNLTQVGEDAWEGLMVLHITKPDAPENQREYVWLATQPLRAEKEGDRWVIVPLEEFRAVYAEGWTSMPTSCEHLPAVVYEAQAGDFTVRVRRQSYGSVDSRVQSSNGFWPVSSYDYTPRPDGEFRLEYSDLIEVDYTGSPADKAKYTHLGLSAAPLQEDGARPELQAPGLGWGGGSSSTGEFWHSRHLKGDWNDHLSLGGGGGFGGESPPDCYAADLYLNGELAGALTLLPVGEGPWTYGFEPAEEISARTAVEGGARIDD